LRYLSCDHNEKSSSRESIQRMNTKFPDPTERPVK
jgi:hypothetical protein